MAVAAKQMVIQVRTAMLVAAVSVAAGARMAAARAPSQTHTPPLPADSEKDLSASLSRKVHCWPCSLNRTIRCTARCQCRLVDGTMQNRTGQPMMTSCLQVTHPATPQTSPAQPGTPALAHCTRAHFPPALRSVLVWITSFPRLRVWQQRCPVCYRRHMQRGSRRAAC